MTDLIGTMVPVMPGQTTPGLTAGVYQDIPDDVYFQIPAVNHSLLKCMDQSPAHCYASVVSPKPGTAAMDFGSLIHTGVLEPETLLDRYVVLPAFETWDQNVTAGKEARRTTSKSTKFYKTKVEEFMTFAETEGKTVVSREWLDVMFAMLAELNSQPIAVQALQRGGGRETVCLWQDLTTGLWCKCKIDGMLPGAAPTILDLKTTQDASTDAFCGTRWAPFFKYFYHSQMAWYQHGYRQALSQGNTWDDDVLIKNRTVPTPNVVILAMEKTPPYASKLHEVPEYWLNAGRTKCMTWLARYSECVANGKWPGYGTDISQIPVPKGEGL